MFNPFDIVPAFVSPTLSTPLIDYKIIQDFYKLFGGISETSQKTKSKKTSKPLETNTSKKAKYPLVLPGEFGLMGFTTKQLTGKEKLPDTISNQKQGKTKVIFQNQMLEEMYLTDPKFRNKINNIASTFRGKTIYVTMDAGGVIQILTPEKNPSDTDKNKPSLLDELLLLDLLNDKDKNKDKTKEITAVILFIIGVIAAYLMLRK